MTEYVVRVEAAEARPLAVARGQTPRPRLGATIIELLDLVWPVLRAQQVRTGHNVVVYLGAANGQLDIEAGVEISDGTAFTPTDRVYRSATPAGEALTATHWGEYSAVSGAYEALARWCAKHNRRPSGLSWEVYGDWSDDPGQLRMDVYQLLEP
jgi:effector-binding domain-containing protein